MKFKGLKESLIVLIFCAASAQSDALQLLVNGDVVTGPNGVTKVEFGPGTKRLSLETFFQDLRCDIPDGVSVPGNADPRFSIDQIGVAEEEAVYPMLQGDVIEYSPGDRLIRIITSGVAATSELDCSHKIPAVGTIVGPGGGGVIGTPDRGATSFHGFEQILRMTVLEPSEGFGFDLLVDNYDEMFVAKGVDVPLSLIVQTGVFPNPTPQFESLLIVDDPATEIVETVSFGGVDLDTGVWSLPALWPGESGILKIRYSNLVPGDSLTMDLDVISTQNRNATLENPIVTVVNTTTSKTVPVP